MNGKTREIEDIGDYGGEMQKQNKWQRVQMQTTCESNPDTKLILFLVSLILSAHPISNAECLV